MATLKDFLVKSENKIKEIKVSDRFTDEKGNPSKFKIRKLTVTETQQIEAECTTQRKTRRGVDRDFNTTKYQNLLMTKSVVFPDLNEKEIQDFYGVMSADKVLPVMLESDEYNALLSEVMELNGMFNGFDEEIEEAKN